MLKELINNHGSVKCKTQVTLLTLLANRLSLSYAKDTVVYSQDFEFSYNG